MPLAAQPHFLPPAEGGEGGRVCPQDLPFDDATEGLSSLLYFFFLFLFPRPLGHGWRGFPLRNLTKPQPILTKPQPDKLLTDVRFGEYGTKKKAGRGVVIPGPACNH